MAGSLQQPSRNGTATALAEINVTPLVDVMLVLLIVFMISAPLMQQGVQVDLPKTTAQTLNETKEPLVLAINKNRQILIGEKAIEPGTLRARLEAIAAARPDVEVFIQADQGLPYGLIAQVMAEVKRAKIHRVGLVTDPSADNRSKL
ncbi:MAG: ExbD/TolR family protein [Oligoflexia bacterium]|jgi:biopolymer transport protein TolR